MGDDYDRAEADYWALSFEEQEALRNEIAQGPQQRDRSEGQRGWLTELAQDYGFNFAVPDAHPHNNGYHVHIDDNNRVHSLDKTMHPFLDGLKGYGLHKAVEDSAKRAKENKVTTTTESKRDKLARELRETRNKLELIEKRVEAMAKYPTEDPFDDGAVITFQKFFGVSRAQGNGYSYAAIRVAGVWFVTGSGITTGGKRNVQGVTWEQLTDWMGSGVDYVWEMTTHRDILEK